MSDLAAIIRRLSQPLEPQPTGVEPRLEKLPGIRAVVFDVYGTLLISGSGDISLTSGVSHGSSAEEATNAAGIQTNTSGDEIVERLQAAIHKRHDDSKHEFPEVEIREVWARVLADLRATVSDGMKKPKARDRVAIEYECRVNPVWPMPAAAETVARLSGRGLALGIVSNAQFFTPIAMTELLKVGGDLTVLGFDRNLCVWSYKYLRAKPGRFLYEKAASKLAERRIEPSETLYLGNDMLNDIWPASRVGFRTALFAGDARSLRLREGDDRVAGLEPDVVVTELPQILDCLG